MTQLTYLQRNFVELLLEHPFKTKREVLFLAGYQGTEEAAHKAVTRFSNNPTILEAIKECATSRLGHLVPKATAALENMISDDQHPAHFRATEAVLNRVGLHEVTEHKTTVEHKLDVTELVTRIRAMTSSLGITSLAGIERLAPAPVRDGDIVEAEVIDPEGGDGAGE